MKALTILIAALIVSPAFAADTYTPAPLQLLTAKVKEHDQQICDLDERLDRLEASIAAKENERAEPAAITPATPAPRYDYDGAVIVPGSERITERVTQQTVLLTAAPRTPIRTIARAVGRRLRTTAEMSRAIRANRTNRVYATISPDTRAWAITHLVNDHGYRRSQVGGLNYADAWMLHNLAHRTSLRVSEYTSGAVVTLGQQASGGRPMVNALHHVALPHQSKYLIPRQRAAVAVGITIRRVVAVGVLVVNAQRRGDRPAVVGIQASYFLGDEMNTNASGPVLTFTMPYRGGVDMSENETVKIDRDLIAEAITDQIDRSSDLSDHDKRRAMRVMNGRFRWQQRARRRMIDKVADELLAEELIVPTADGVEAAVDWEAILGFIKELLPVILQLIALFG